MSSISILGCGWLGFPLAKACVRCGYEVRGSTTLPAKRTRLQKENIRPFILSYTPRREQEAGEFFKTQNLFLNIPFKRNLPEPQFYFQQVQAVMNDAKRSGIERVLFASSTSVYPENVGIVSEGDRLKPADERAEVLRRTEELVAQEMKHSVIFRFGGLVGGGRNVGRFLSGRTELSDPLKPVNLIHLDDCLSIILKFLEREDLEGIYNVVCDGHPTREALYTAMAERAGLPAPRFSMQASATFYKLVSNEKLKKDLGYGFIHPDPFRFPS